MWQRNKEDEGCTNVGIQGPRARNGDTHGPCHPLFITRLAQKFLEPRVHSTGAPARCQNRAATSQTVTLHITPAYEPKLPLTGLA